MMACDTLARVTSSSRVFSASRALMRCSTPPRGARVQRRYAHQQILDLRREVAQVFLLGVAQHEVTEAAAPCAAAPSSPGDTAMIAGRPGRPSSCVEERCRRSSACATSTASNGGRGCSEQGLRLGDAVVHLDLPAQRPARPGAHTTASACCASPSINRTKKQAWVSRARIQRTRRCSADYGVVTLAANDCFYTHAAHAALERF